MSDLAARRVWDSIRELGYEDLAEWAEVPNADRRAFQRILDDFSNADREQLRILRSTLERLEQPDDSLLVDARIAYGKSRDASPPVRLRNAIKAVVKAARAQSGESR